MTAKIIKSFLVVIFWIVLLFYVEEETAKSTVMFHKEGGEGVFVQSSV